MDTTGHSVNTAIYKHFLRVCNEMFCSSKPLLLRYSGVMSIGIKLHNKHQRAKKVHTLLNRYSYNDIHEAIIATSAHIAWLRVSRVSQRFIVSSSSSGRLGGGGGRKVLWYLIFTSSYYILLLLLLQSVSSLHCRPHCWWSGNCQGLCIEMSLVEREHTVFQFVRLA